MAKKKKEEIVNVSDNILLEGSEVKSIKEELKKYVDEKVDKVFIDELDKSNRKLLREKSKKIFIKNIVIILLLLIIAFLVYLLYTNNYFDRFFNNEKNVPTEKEEIKEEEKKEEEKKEETKKEEVKKPTLDELKEKYGKLIDSYKINEKSSYLNEFYDGNLTNELKHYLTLYTLDFNSIEKEDDYQIISLDTFKSSYEKLFNDELESISFDYNSNKVRYVKVMKSYMTETLLKDEESNIVREIIDIKEDGGDVIIVTLEGVIEDNKLTNIKTGKVIEEYKGDSLVNYKELLNEVVDHFKNNKLTSLGK